MCWARPRRDARVTPERGSHRRAGGTVERRGFEERAGLELARARREGDRIAVAVFDLDYFKRINDEWGHDIGDRVLVRTAEVLVARAGEIDVVARFGGEEFVVMLPGTDSEQAQDFAERVRAALTIESPSGLPTARISAGIRAALAPISVGELLQGADSALYAAKRSGRDRAVVFDRTAHGRRVGARAPVRAPGRRDSADVPRGSAELPRSSADAPRGS